MALPERLHQLRRQHRGRRSSSTSCSSEATGRGSGIAGLIVSAARDASTRLVTPRTSRPAGACAAHGERDRPAPHDDRRRHQLRPGDRSARRRPSLPGRSRHVALRDAARLRPVHRLRPRERRRPRSQARRARARSRPKPTSLEPDWLTTFDPDARRRVEIRGSAAARRATRYGTSSQSAAACSRRRTATTRSRRPPAAPRRSTTSRSASGDVAGTGARCAFDPDAVPQTAPSGVDVAEQHARHVHLHDAPAGDGRRGPRRRGRARTIFVHHDPDLPAAFPPASVAAASRRRSSPSLTGLGGARRQQILFATSRRPVHANRANGEARARLAGRRRIRSPAAHRLARASRPAPCRRPWANRSASASRSATSTATAARRRRRRHGGQGLRLGSERDSARPASPSHRALASRRTRARPHNRAERGIIASPALADLDGDRRSRSSSAAWTATSTSGTACGVAAARLPGAGRRPDAHGVDRSGDAPGRPEAGNGQAVALAGHEDRFHAGRRPAPRRRQARHRRRHQRGLPRGAELRVDGNGTIGLFVSAGVALAGERPRLRDPGARQRSTPRRREPGGPLPRRAGRSGSRSSRTSCCRGSRATPGAPALADIDGDGTLEVGIASVVGPGVPLPRRRHVVLRRRAPAVCRARSRPTPPAWAPTRRRPRPYASIARARQRRVRADRARRRRRLRRRPAPASAGWSTRSSRRSSSRTTAHLIAYRATTGDVAPALPAPPRRPVFLGSPSIADVSGDDVPEILIGSGGYLVHAVDATGVEAPGWPKFTGGWIIASPAVSSRFDIKGQVVAVTTREATLGLARPRPARRPGAVAALPPRRAEHRLPHALSPPALSPASRGRTRPCAARPSRERDLGLPAEDVGGAADVDDAAPLLARLGRSVARPRCLLFAASSISRRERGSRRSRCRCRCSPAPSRRSRARAGSCARRRRRRRSRASACRRRSR